MVIEDSENRPIYHLTARLAWHDLAWNGCICQRPQENTSCVEIRSIRKGRKDERERASAACCVKDLDGWIPPCSRDINTYSNTTSRFVHSDPGNTGPSLKEFETKVEPYTTCCVAYRWLREERLQDVLAEHNLVLPGPDTSEKTSGWVQEPERQKRLLDECWKRIEEKKSLIFYYVKNHPVLEDASQLLIGIGRISKKGSMLYFDVPDKPGIRYPVWERHITQNYPDEGVRLPYQEYLDKGLDATTIACRVPPCGGDSFAYVAELVTDDLAVGLIERMIQAVQRVRDDGHIQGDWDKRLEWLNQVLSEVWQNRGLYPGMGSVLEYLGHSRGTACYRIYLSKLAKQGIDPLQHLLEILEQGISCDDSSYEPGFKKCREKWSKLPPERQRLLEQLCHFELTKAQVERISNPEQRKNAGISCTDALLDNPYMISEQDLGTSDSQPVSLESIDRGMHPDQMLGLGGEAPELDDRRRVRATLKQVLREAAAEGHTLLDLDNALKRVTEYFPERRSCRPDRDLVLADKEFFDEECVIEDHEDLKTIALRNLHDFEIQVRTDLSRMVTRKNEAEPKKLRWAELLADRFDDDQGAAALDAEAEKRAREEKTRALRTLFQSRVSVLTGHAGTGKTAVLQVLIRGLKKAEGNPAIQLLAPTGKARVRLAVATERDALTIHQFLLKYGWLDADTMTIKETGNSTPSVEVLIIDEASMLPMDLFGALLKAVDLRKLKRLILVGDPNQLPPIGAGRPFVDIIDWLSSDEKRATNIARLTERARHEDGNSQALMLADTYLRDRETPTDDEMLSRVARKDVGGDLEVHYWETEKELVRLLFERLQANLGIESPGNGYGSFMKSFGMTEKGQPVEGDEDAEHWQILTPLRGQTTGSTEINRIMQKLYKEGLLHNARGKNDKSRSFGKEELVWTDKIINVRNHKREGWPRNDAFDYIANGEIGMVEQTDKMGRHMDVRFTTQPEVTYRYWGSDVDNYLELAYALTVHKSQGSDFDQVYLILPQTAFTLSRELLYTAMTRFRQRLVLLIEKDISTLLQMREGVSSATLQRNTNLFQLSLKPLQGESIYPDGLIHRMKDGTLVRSKSEVIVGNTLLDLGLKPDYEQRLNSLDDTNDFRLPDFTVSYYGDTFYWEHLGMLRSTEYRAAWEKKLKWYEANGFSDRLIFSKDEEDGSIDSQAIERMAKEKIMGE